MIDELVGGDVPRAKTDFRIEVARRDACAFLRGAPGDDRACSATTTCSRPGSTSPRASSACGSRASISVAGFGDFDIGRVLDPPVTTVVADAAALGRMAFEVLSEQMAGGTPADRTLGGRARGAGLDRCRLTSRGKPR